jgi:DNA-binding NarL/FixJ family response regulator
MMTPHITLVIAHNHHIFRAILKNFLQSCAGICVLANVDTAKALLEKIKELQPDVVLAGLDLNGMADVHAWQKMLSECGKTKMVISWQHCDAAKIPAMIPAAHTGYIAWDASPAEYLYAVKQAVKGKESYCSQTQILRDSAKQAATFANDLDATSLEILFCIWMGYSNKEIAMATGLKESTVKSYRKKLKSSTGFRSAAGLEKMVKGKS